MPRDSNRFVAGKDAGLALLLLSMLWPTTPASAACPDWQSDWDWRAEAEQEQVLEDVLDAVPGVGALFYRTGYANVGFGHVASMVELDWRERDEQRRQLLFASIHDGPPAALAPTTEGLAVPVEYCLQSEETCETQTAAYVYDPESRAFRGLDELARSALFEACPVDAAE